MINIELLEQLKMLGFPKDDFYVNTNPSINSVVNTGLRDATVFNPPTFSELIEVLGDRFYGVTRIRVENAIESLNDFEAREWVKFGEEPEITFGKTPEEAVAKLWLALNEKK